MAFFLKKLVAALALSSTLLFSPSLKADVKSDMTLEQRVKRSNYDYSKFKLNFEMGQVTLFPGKIPSMEDTLLNEIDDKLSLLTIGVSTDYNFIHRSLSKNASFNSDVGLFIDFSSSKLFDYKLKDSGSTNYEGIDASYRLRGDLDYFSIGARLFPSILYKSGPFKLGFFLEGSGGFMYLKNTNNFNASANDENVVKYLQSQEIENNVKGEINVEGLGGFMQLFIGPTFEIYDVACYMGVGYRYDIFKFDISEKINKTEFIDEQVNSYEVDYNVGNLALKGRCGVKF